MLSVSLLAGCGENGSRKMEDVAPVRVKEMTVSAQPLSGGFQYSGTVEAENGTLLSFPVGGTIERLAVKVGDCVRKGDLIASVNPTVVENNYNIAHSARVRAEDAFSRMKQLHEAGSLPDVKWVEAQSALEQAVSLEEIARKNLRDCNLYAPFSGVVSAKKAEVGQNVIPGMPVVELVTVDVLHVEISVPEHEIAGLNIGDKADITVPALQSHHYSGTVLEKGIVADPLSRSYAVKIRVAGSDGMLLPGMVASVCVGSDPGEPEIVIPARLIQTGDDNTVFVWVDRGGRAERCPVECGGYFADGVRIVSGLKEGDKVICEGQQKVGRGTLLTTK